MIQYQVVGTNIILNGPEACAEYASKHQMDVRDALCKKVESTVVGLNSFVHHPWTEAIHFGTVIYFKETLTQEEKEVFLELLKKDCEREDYQFSDDYSFTKNSVLVWLSRDDDESKTEGYFEISPLVISALPY